MNFTQKNWGLFSIKWWLLLCSSLTVMAGATLTPSLPQMAEHFSEVPNAEFWVKFSLSVPGIVIAISAIFLGMLFDRGHKFRLLILYLIAYAILGSVGFFLDHSLFAIIASRAALGVAVAGLMVGVTTLAADYFKGANLQSYMGLQAAFGSLGGVLFIFVSGLLAEYHWRWPFLLHGIAFLWVALVPFLATQSAPQKQELAGPDTTERERALPKPEAVDTTLPPMPLLMAFGALALVEILMLYAIPLHFPFYLSQSFSLDSQALGGVVAALFLVVSVVSIFYRQLKQNLSFVQVHCISFLSVSIGFTVLSLGSNLALLASAIILLGFGFGFMRPNLVVWLFEHCSPVVRGRVMGGLTSCFFAGQFLSLWVLQPAVTQWGERGAFAMAAAIAMSAVMIPLGVHAMTKSNQRTRLS